MTDPRDIDLGEVHELSKIKDINLEHVKKLSEYGHTDSFMADFFNVNDKTWLNWKLRHPEFRKALEGWRGVANERVEKALYEKAVGFQHREEKVHWDKDGCKDVHITMKQYPPSEAAAMSWLKNRKGKDWKDKHEVTVNDSLGAAILRARKRRKCEAADDDEGYLE